jgi:hypothetical protein
MLALQFLVSARRVNQLWQPWTKPSTETSGSDRANTAHTLLPLALHLHLFLVAFSSSYNRTFLFFLYSSLQPNTRAAAPPPQLPICRVAACKLVSFPGPATKLRHTHCTLSTLE